MTRSTNGTPHHVRACSSAAAQGREAAAAGPGTEQRVVQVLRRRAHLQVRERSVADAALATLDRGEPFAPTLGRRARNHLLRSRGLTSRRLRRRRPVLRVGSQAPSGPQAGAAARPVEVLWDDVAPFADGAAPAVRARHTRASCDGAQRLRRATRFGDDGARRRPPRGRGRDGGRGHRAPGAGWARPGDDPAPLRRRRPLVLRQAAVGLHRRDRAAGAPHPHARHRTPLRTRRLSARPAPGHSPAISAASRTRSVPDMSCGRSVSRVFFSASVSRRARPIRISSAPIWDSS